MMAVNYSLEYLGPAESYYVQHILIDMALLIFLLKEIILYRIRPGQHKKQGMWHLTIVYLQFKTLENTSILCLNWVSQHC